MQQGEEPQEEPRKAGRGRKRQQDDTAAGLDPVQQRQLKNRASAARSRDRKIAYTASLEERVTALQAENALLRQALADAGVKLPAGVGPQQAQ
jgi:hypothetical protein